MAYFTKMCSKQVRERSLLEQYTKLDLKMNRRKGTMPSVDNNMDIKELFKNFLECGVCVIVVSV